MYQKKDNSELKEIFKKRASLSYSSKIGLLKEIQKRDLEVNQESLRELVTLEEDKIKNFDYLKELGFDINIGNKTIGIRRRYSAVLRDIVATILSLLFFMLGSFDVIVLMVMYMNDMLEISLSTFLIIVVDIALIVLGIKLFNGFKRLITYFGFRFEVRDRQVTMNKRVDYKLKSMKTSLDNLVIEPNNNISILKLHNTEILNWDSENMAHESTVNELYKRLKNCC